MDEDIKKLIKANTELLKQNVELSEKILKLSSKTQKYLFFQQVVGVLKILIIVGPIIIGIIYLPPLMQQLFASYQEMLSGLGVEGGLDQLAPELLKYLQ